MVDFICDDKETEKLLKKLYKLVTSNGGLVHDKLTIGCMKGDLKITIDENVRGGEKIIILPKHCLLPVDKFKLDLKGNDIVIKDYDKGLTKGQVDMMKTMMALYNRTKKIAAQKKCCTYGLYYHDKDLFNHILKSRNVLGMPFFADMDNRSKKEFYLDSFIKTRVLGYREPAEEDDKDAIWPQGESGPPIKRTKVLMPIIDFLNHHPKAIGFLSRMADVAPSENSEEQYEEYDDEGIAVAKSCPVEGSNECYVFYGPYDAIDTFINYNYAEQYTPYVRSVPVQINLLHGLGTLTIEGSTGAPHHKKIPDPVKDLRFYIPSIVVDRNAKKVTLGFIFIPHARAPRALRRILALGISRIDNTVDRGLLTEAILDAERIIINENLKYYKGLNRRLKKYEASSKTKMIIENARMVAEVQLRNLKNYPFFEEATASVKSAAKKKTARKSAKKTAKKTPKKKAKKTAKKSTRKRA